MTRCAFSSAAVGRPKRPPARERGSALLVVILLGVALGSAAAVVAMSTLGSAAELRARANVLCARYAADGGLAAGPVADGRPGLVSDRVEHLEVRAVQRTADWCVLRATAQCGAAVRAVERNVDCLRFRPPP